MSARVSVVPVFVPHWGCPHDCVFCNQRRITGRREPATAQTVQEAMQQAAALPSGAKRQLAFYGGSFTAIPAARQEELLAAAQPWLESGALSSLRVSTRPDAIDAETLERLRRYGVETIELGAQSMDDHVLALAGRGHTAADVERAARLVKDAGFELILQMMTGLPGDSDDGAIDTSRQLIALSPDAVRIYPTVVVRGTELEKLWRSGACQEHSVEDAVRVCAKLLPMFDAAGIPVIRLGLNPTEELSGGAALAGAYHPALGELVRSRVLRNRAEEMLTEMNCEEGFVTIYVPEKQLSQMLGQKRCNSVWLQERFRLNGLRIAPDPKLDDLRIELENYDPRCPA